MWVTQPHAPLLGHSQETFRTVPAPHLFVGSVTPSQSRCPSLMFSVPHWRTDVPGTGGSTSDTRNACTGFSHLLSPERHPEVLPQFLTSARPWPLPSCCHFFPQRPEIPGSMLGLSESVFMAGHGPAHPAPSALLVKVTKDLGGAPVPHQPLSTSRPGVTLVSAAPSTIEVLFFEVGLQHCLLNRPR